MVLDARTMEPSLERELPGHVTFTTHGQFYEGHH